MWHRAIAFVFIFSGLCSIPSAQTPFPIPSAIYGEPTSLYIHPITGPFSGLPENKPLPLERSIIAPMPGSLGFTPLRQGGYKVGDSNIELNTREKLANLNNLNYDLQRWRSNPAHPSAPIQMPFVSTMAAADNNAKKESYTDRCPAKKSNHKHRCKHNHNGKDDHNHDHKNRGRNKNSYSKRKEEERQMLLQAQRSHRDTGDPDGSVEYSKQPVYYDSRNRRPSDQSGSPDTQNQRQPYQNNNNTSQNSPRRVPLDNQPGSRQENSNPGRNNQQGTPNDNGNQGGNDQSRAPLMNDNNNEGRNNQQAPPASSPNDNGNQGGNDQPPKDNYKEYKDKQSGPPAGTKPT